MISRAPFLASPAIAVAARRTMSDTPKDINKVRVVGRVVDPPSFYKFQKEGSTGGVSTIRVVTVEHIKVADKEWDGRTFHTVSVKTPKDTSKEAIVSFKIKSFQSDVNDQILAAELQPGNWIEVDGKLRGDSWTGRDGAKRSRIVIEIGKEGSFKLLNRDTAPVQ
ncbi:hypothetical protein HDU93_008006 [Gonapodya sp. JEL0774]|nr:hypothetical protein HDU93_008006 [Gonapodya sp. JEL0774]